MTRKDIREGIARYFGGVIWDAAAEIYRPTPLQAYGLAGVKPYWPLRYTDQDRLTTLAADRGMGAVMGVHFPETIERRIAFGGIKRVTFTVDLPLFHLSVLASATPSSLSQADADELVEAIILHIRADATLGGAVVEAGESEAGIKVSAGPPVNEPALRVMQDLVVSFEADVYPFDA